MKTLNVHTQQPYTITVANGWHLPMELFGSKVCLVTDTNVAPLYLQQVTSSLGEKEVFPFVIPAGEQSKNPQTYLELVGYLASNNFSRKDTVVALGGGVVGDLAGFAAATFLRGVGFVQLPTTLLSMIDASVGGKTAVDLPQGKNMLGAFYQPNGVYINLDTLSTLPQVELDNGKGELAKYAFLSSDVAKGNLDICPELIAECLKIKIDLVERDERDGGVRMLLNLGHTVGHAVEKLSNYTLPHGLCVAKGLSAAITLSQKYFGFDAEKTQQMRQLLAKFGLDTSLPYTKQQIVSQIVFDKKAHNGTVNFVVIRDVGNCQVVPIEHKELINLL